MFIGRPRLRSCSAVKTVRALETAHDVLDSGRGASGDDSWWWRRVYRQAVRPVHARLHRHQLRAEHRFLLLRRASVGDAVLSLSPGLEPLQMLRVRRHRRHTGVRPLIAVRITRLYAPRNINMAEV